ncbi:MAG: hypothetical protein Q4D21_10545 [Phascolarctobacterium sp.]|nr:hypothetical protein [Phascolarctobacterium sp.]
MDTAGIVSAENLEEECEEKKLIEFFRMVDEKYYHRKIENRKNEITIFPHRGESGQLFANTFGYVGLFKKH